MRCTSLFVLVAAVLGINSLAYGDVTIDHVDRGAFNSTLAAGPLGGFKVPSGSYQVRAVNPAAIGGSGPAIEATRNYSVFDLSGLSGSITGATLRIAAAGNSYNSSAASETVDLFSVSTSPSELLLGNGGASPGAVFPDLGSGTLYGDFDITLADNDAVLEAILNPAAVADLNAAVGSGSWAIGGALATIDSSYDGIWERVLRGSATSSPATELVLTGSVVPEPATATMLILALTAFGSLRRRVC